MNIIVIYMDCFSLRFRIVWETICGVILLNKLMLAAMLSVIVGYDNGGLFILF